MNSVRDMIQQKRNSGRPVYPVGRAFARFPLLTEMTFGLQGIFVVVGATGVGKSTLAAHLAADVVGESFPGVYYDSENSYGDDSLTFGRIDHSYGDDPRLDHLAHTTKFEQALEWTRARSPRGFLVVDAIPGSLDISDHDASLDAGPLRGLERRSKQLIALAEEGYAVLVVSQTNDRNTKVPPSLGALKGASALEQMAWTVVAYGTNSKAGDLRAVVLRKLRRPVATAWPLDSRLLIRTDGQDGLSEAGRGRQEKDTADTVVPPPAERVAEVLRQSPRASVREVARRAEVSKSVAGRLMKGVPEGCPRGVPWDSSGTVGGTADSADAA